MKMVVNKDDNKAKKAGYNINVTFCDWTNHDV